MERREQDNNQESFASTSNATRFSARVRAAQRQRDEPSIEQPSEGSSHSNKRSPTRTRTLSAPSASTTKHPARALRSNISAISINEPVRDLKGKKRGAPAPDSSSEGEQQASSSKPASNKRLRVTRSSTTNTTSKSTTAMPRKNRISTSSGAAAVKTRSGKSRPSLNTSNSGPHSAEESDIEMADGGAYESDDGNQLNLGNYKDGDGEITSERQRVDTEVPGPSSIEAPEHAPDSSSTALAESSNPPAQAPPQPLSTTAASLLSALAGDDTSAAALSMFGADFRSLGQHMMAQTSKLKGYLEAIKPSSDPLVRYSALQELNELLVMSNEDTLSGYFQVEAFAKELIGILGGKRISGAGDDDDDDDDEGEGHGEDEDEDAALAAALAMSTGGVSQGDENPEAQVLASRCLYNMMEALPGTAHTVVFHGAIPALCSKLTEIQFIDLAEQNISTLDKISEECASSVARQGGFPALLSFLDFFNTSVQRTAMHAAANCCRNASPDIFKIIRDQALPTIQNVLSYPDQRLVESAALCVLRIIESYHRSAPDLLDELLAPQGDDKPGLLRAVNTLLLPAGGSPVISAGTYTLFLRALSAAARSSSKTAIALLEAGFASTVYQILTGVLPPEESSYESQSGNPQDQGLGGGVADMTVMESIANRPKDQVEEALSLVSELMPVLPKDGIFDNRAYSEKALAKMFKQKSKAERAAARLAKAAANTSMNSDIIPEAEGAVHITTNPPAVEEATNPESQEPIGSGANVESILSGTITRGTSPGGSDVAVIIAPPSRSVVTSTRSELMQEKSEVIIPFMRLMMPVLVEVYAASVAVNIRTRALAGILKIANFLEFEVLWKIVERVPLASFIGSILSSRDHQTLLIGALQLVEILLIKLPVEYKTAFRREGVLHEIQTLADLDLSTKVKAEPISAATTPTPDDSSMHFNGISSNAALRRAMVQPLDSQDTTIIRARVIRFRYLASSAQDGEDGDNDELERLRAAVERLASPDVEIMGAESAVKTVGELFGRQESPLSSFEMLKSGLINGLLEFCTSETGSIDLAARQKLVFDTLARGSATSSPLATLVKRLQESLTRMENFEVVTVSPGGDDSRRNSASLLARQLRLRLVGEGSDIPKSCTNITVSIHAIATFQALHDYLRPRVSNTGGTTSSRLTGMLAAFAAAAGIPSGAISRPPDFIPPGQSVAGGSTTNDAALSDSTVGTDAASGVSGITIDNALVAQEPNLSEKNEDSGPRRSRRLSSKAVGSKSVPMSPKASSSNVAAPPEPTSQVKSEIMDTMDSENYIEADVDPEDLEDEQDDSPQDEKTVNLAIAEDGDKVVAQTPDGTRVATPNPQRNGLSDSSAGTRTSYASALKAKPTDWHLEFSIEGHPISLETTIYGAIHQHEARRSTKPALYLSAIWSSVYTIKFKKVPGPSPTPESPADALVSVAPAVPDDSAHAQILRLLRVLHKINCDVQTAIYSVKSTNVLPENAFVNNKLTAKLTRQLEEPMIVASACLPDWAVDLSQHYPFLFPFSTRFSFLQSTSFGYARLILKWQNQQTRSSDNSSRRDDTFGYLGRLQRQKVRISRKHLLESAIKVLELYGSSSSVLEVEYFEEVGTGLGPTLEFYSLVSREFARRDIKIWHDIDATIPGQFTHHPTGLYPAPFSPSEVTKEKQASGKKRSDLFRVLGQFIAKALLDSRIIDMSFNRTFLRLVRGEDVPHTIETLLEIDPALASSLYRVQQYALAQREIENDVALSTKTRESALESIIINDATLSDLSLDFTLPGYSIDLLPGGADTPVDHRNVNQYIKRVLDVFLEEGVRVQVNAFREGFSRVFPITDLQAFSSEELLTIFGNPNEDWSFEVLTDAIKADHGFNTDSRPFRDLVHVMSSYDLKSRREFLQFITGSPKLPIGGFRGLTPALTVVRKPHEPPLLPDDYLPSVMTCVNYLKLPSYSTRDVLAAKLATAMKEGGGSFHLS